MPEQSAHFGPPADSLNTHSFVTERLAIEVPAPEDAPALFHLVGGPDRRAICATLIWDGPDDIGVIEEWVASTAAETYGHYGYHWIIRDRTGAVSGTAGAPLGAIGTRPRAEPGRADVGYWLGRPYWGQGVMGEALAALIAFGFSTLDLYKLEAEVFLGNERGLRLVESAGMTREGVVRRAHRKYGEFVDAAVYGLLREDAPSD